MIIHMLPGSGKTWLAQSDPESFIDGDVLYEKFFPGAWKSRVHLIEPKLRAMALRSPKTVLTNDHEMADVSVIHARLEDYLERASSRLDLDPLQLATWYREALGNPRVTIEEDPQLAVFQRYSRLNH